jgi:hypothetical protein
VTAPTAPLASPAPPASQTTTVVATSAPTPAVTASPAPEPVVTASVPPPLAKPAPSDGPASALSAGGSLSAERTLLDLARAALARGETAAAFDALGQHQKRFARGVFREEREALTIQALRGSGRPDEAKRRALAFKTRYPKSLFLSTIERVLEPNP